MSLITLGVPPIAQAQSAPALARPAVDLSPSIEELYAQLQQVGLDEHRVYKVRNLAFDRAAFHISLEDGVIGFTQDVLGKVTGAFFQGEGEVLLLPPNQVERASMTLFTGAAILEERFSSAYFRFNDDTFDELRPALIPADDARQFVSDNAQFAKELAAVDALRLLLTLTRRLPSQGARPAHEISDRMLHARVQGEKLGNFDMYYDSTINEQIWAGQLRTVEGSSYYNVWTSFAGPQAAVKSGGNGPGEQFGPQDILDFLDYKIRASVTPPRQVSAEAFINVQVKTTGERAVLFELSRFLKIKTVECDGQPVGFIHNQALEGTQLSRRGNDLVLVVFRSILQAGQRLTLHFSYEGDVLSEAGGGLLYVGARGTWYPNRGSGTSNFDLQFRYPAGWTLVATGKPVSPVSGGPANNLEQVGRWISQRPIPLAGFNLGKYSRSEAHAGNTLVETYAASGVERTFPRTTVEATLPDPIRPTFGHSSQIPIAVTAPPPSPAHNTQFVADEAARAVTFFTTLYGPFPYPQLALAQMPGDLSQGWPSMVFLSSFSFLTTEEKSHLHLSDLDNVLSSTVVAHEIAHQWWGDLVSWKTYRDQWLVEALANYSSLLLLESRDPAKFQAVMQKFRDNLLVKNKQEKTISQSGPVTLGVRLSNSEFPDGYETISYGRGTWLLHMLRTMMRDGESTGDRRGALSQEPFFRALLNLRQQYEGKPMTTREMLHAFEEELPRPVWHEGKRSLDWFLTGWINGASVPRLELQRVKFTEQSRRVLVTGVLLQQDADKDLITSVPIYANAKDRNVFLGRVFADGGETSFQLVAPPGTRRIVIDPQHTVLSQRR